MSIRASGQEPSQTPEPTKNLEISFAAFNKKTKQWDYVSPKAGDNVQEFMEKHGGTEILKEAMPGEVLEFTEKGIYKKQGEKWITALTTPESKSKFQAIQSALKTFKQSVELFFRQSRSSIPAEKQPGSEEIKKTNQSFIDNVVKKEGFFTRKKTDFIMQVRVLESPPESASKTTQVAEGAKQRHLFPVTPEGIAKHIAQFPDIDGPRKNFAKIAREAIQTELSFYGMVLPLFQAYANKRDELQGALLAGGLTPTEIGIFIGYFDEVQVAMTQMTAKLNHLNELIKDSSKTEAEIAQTLNDIYINDFPKYAQVVQKGVYAIDILNEKDQIDKKDKMGPISKEIKKTFGDAIIAPRGLPLSAMFIAFTQRIPRHEMLLKDMVKHFPYSPEGVKPGSFQKALDDVSSTIKKINEDKRTFDQIVNPGTPFTKTLMEGEKGKVRLKDLPEWHGILNDKGLSEAKLKELDKLYQQYGIITSELKKAQLAIENSPNNPKAKEAYDRLRRHYIGEINALNKRYNKMKVTEMLGQVRIAINEAIENFTALAEAAESASERDVNEKAKADLKEQAKSRRKQIDHLKASFPDEEFKIRARFVNDVYQDFS